MEQGLIISGVFGIVLSILIIKFPKFFIPFTYTQGFPRKYLNNSVERIFGIILLITAFVFFITGLLY